MPRILNSIDAVRVRRRVEELIAEGVSKLHAERRARAEVGRQRATIKRQAAGDWKANIITRGAN